MEEVATIQEQKLPLTLSQLLRLRQPNYLLQLPLPLLPLPQQQNRLRLLR
jgi:hypothetical protein